MKKETVILSVVVAFLVGFITGAITYWGFTGGGSKGGKQASMPQQKPQMPPQGVPEPEGPVGPTPAEVASKIQTLKDILQKDPKNLPAWVELGNLYFDSKQPKEAIEAYARYLAIKPDNADVRTDLAIMYRSLGDFDRAVEEFKKAAQSDSKHVNSRYNIGLVLLHDKQDIKGAIKAWEEYLEVDTKSERATRIKNQIEKMRTMVK